MQGEVAARILHQALRLARQDDIAAQAEDEIGIAIGHDQLHQFGIGKVAVAPHQDMGLRPMLPQQAQYPEGTSTLFMIMAFSAPVGRKPGRRTAVTKAPKWASNTSKGR